MYMNLLSYILLDSIVNNLIKKASSSEFDGLNVGCLGGRQNSRYAELGVTGLQSLNMFCFSGIVNLIYTFSIIYQLVQYLAHFEQHF